MLEPWNDCSVQPPPVYTYKNEGNVDVKQLIHICENIVQVLSKRSELHKESAILSRLIYKFDRKFRHDIGFKNLKKVNTALKRYLRTNLLKDVEHFLAVLPSEEDDSYVPTKQMLEYVQVRLMTFSKIMTRVYICSKKAAIFYLDRIKRGESHWMSLVPYALLSRLWSISSVLLDQSCTWYIQLFPFLNILESKGLPFLPDAYELPENLSSWIDLKNIDKQSKFSWAGKKIIETDNIALIEEEEEEHTDILSKFIICVNNETPDTKNDITPEIYETDQNRNKNECFKDSVYVPMKVRDEAPKFDQGEKISRDIFKSIFGKTEVSLNLKNKLTCIHSIERIKNKKSLKDFIDREEEYRSNSNISSLTSHLTFMQWQALKTALLKLHESVSIHKIENKFKKIWKAKCLHYCEQ